jgi:K319L-like, PKD domain
MKKKLFVLSNILDFFIHNFSFVVFAFLIILKFSCPTFAIAAPVTLKWDPSAQATGYKLHYGFESNSYEFVIDVGPDLQHTLSDLNENQVHYFAVTAYNENGESGFSEEISFNSFQNKPPISDAGPNQNVNESKLVTLNGSNSIDPDDGIASYHWEQIEGPVVEVSNSEEEITTFTTPDIGTTGETLVFKLSVKDYGNLVSSDTCIINVSSINTPPKADAGSDKNVSEGLTVTLDASNSFDQDDGIYFYQWSQISGTTVNLNISNPVKATFIAPNVDQQGESLKFQLTVADNGGLQSQDICIVNVSWVNVPPSADAGPDLVVQQGQTVTLNGSGSKDFDDGIALCQWTQTSGPPVDLSSAAVFNPTFVAPEPSPEGTPLSFIFTITDLGGLQAQDSCTVKVESIPPPPERTDKIQITKSQFYLSKGQLILVAISDAPPKSITMTAWAEYSNKTVELGTLRYNRKNNRYYNSFRKIRIKPDRIAVKSSNGGYHSQECLGQ